MQRGWALVVCCGVAHAFIQSASSWRRARPARSPQRVGSRLRSVTRLQRINETHFEYSFEDEGSSAPPWEALDVKWPPKEWGPNSSERLKRTLLQDDGVDWFADDDATGPAMPEEGTPGLPEMPTLVLPDEDEILEQMPMIPEWIGEFLGCDAPLDAPWRVQAEALVRSAVPDEDLSLRVEDVKWDHTFVHVAIATDARDPDADGGGARARALEPNDLACAERAIAAALEPREDELEVLNRHTLNVYDATDVPLGELWLQRQFDAHAGKRVACTTHSRMQDDPDAHPGRTLRGTLIERNVNDLVLDCGSGGREVRIPNHLVWTVKDEDGKDPPKP